MSIQKSNPEFSSAYVRVVLSPQLSVLSEACEKLYSLQSQVRSTVDRESKLVLSVEFVRLVKSINFTMSRIDAVCNHYGICSEEILQ